MRNIIKILCALFVLCSLMGCIFSEDYQVLTANWLGNQLSVTLESGVSVTREYFGSAVRLDDHPGSEPEKVIQVAGEEKRCEFFMTKAEPETNYLTHLYHDQNGKYIIFDEEENVVFCSFSSDDSEAEKVFSMEEGLQIAREFLGGYVDVEDYQVHSESIDGKYLYSFVKHIGEYATLDRAFITVSHSGKLLSYSSTMLGRIPIDTNVSFDMDEVEEAIIEKLDTMYDEIRGQYAEITYSIHDNKSVTFGETGEPLLICWVDISCVQDSSDDTSVITDTIEFVVPMVS